MEDISSTLVFESPEAIKSIEIKDGKATVGAYAIRFSGPEQKDLQGEYFTADTYLGAHKGDGVDVLFNHGQAPTKAFDDVCNMVMAAAKSSIDAVGVFVQHVLDLSNEYEAAIAKLVAAGKLKWSSGATSHMVKRTDSGEIQRWPIAEFSYTPTPAEPRLPAISPLKSMTFTESETLELSKAFVKSEVDKKSEADPPNPLLENNMDDPEIQKQIDAEVKARVEEILKDQEKIQAAVKARTREIEEIYAIGDKFGRRGEATRFVEENKSLGEFQTFILDRLNAKGMVALSLKPEPDSNTMKRKEFETLSVGRRMSFLKSGGQITD